MVRKLKVSPVIKRSDEDKAVSSKRAPLKCVLSSGSTVSSRHAAADTTLRLPSHDAATPSAPSFSHVPSVTSPDHCDLPLSPPFQHFCESSRMPFPYCFPPSVRWLFSSVSYIHATTGTPLLQSFFAKLSIPPLFSPKRS